MFMRFRLKTHYFPHTVHYCCSSMLRLSETKLIVLRSKACSDWPALQCTIYPNTSRVRWKCYAPLPHWRDKNNKTQYKEGICCTDYNDLYCLNTLCVALRRVNITMSAFVIWETTNNKHYAARLKTHVWIISGKIFTKDSVLTSCE